MTVVCMYFIVFIYPYINSNVFINTPLHESILITVLLCYILHL